MLIVDSIFFKITKKKTTNKAQRKASNLNTDSNSKRGICQNITPNLKKQPSLAKNYIPCRFMYIHQTVSIYQFYIGQNRISSKLGNYQEDLPRFCFGDQSTYDETRYVTLNFSCSWKGNVNGNRERYITTDFSLGQRFCQIQPLSISIYIFETRNQCKVYIVWKWNQNHYPRKIYLPVFGTDKVTRICLHSNMIFFQIKHVLSQTK